MHWDVVRARMPMITGGREKKKEKTLLFFYEKLMESNCTSTFLDKMGQDAVATLWWKIVFGKNRSYFGRGWGRVAVLISWSARVDIDCILVGL